MIAAIASEFHLDARYLHRRLGAVDPHGPRACSACSSPASSTGASATAASTAPAPRAWAGWGLDAVHPRLRAGAPGRPDRATRLGPLPRLRAHVALLRAAGPAFRELNTSLGFDRRLWPHDIAQSRAHARMLAAQGIIGDDDRDAILAGLDAVEAELRDGTFPFEPDDEDIHMAVERRLTEIAGRPAASSTPRARATTRSRPTSRCSRATPRGAAQAQLDALMAALVEAAERHLDWPLPGYTHLQRAQPVYLSHHLLAYVWMLARDRERFARRRARRGACRSARARWRA